MNIGPKTITKMKEMAAEHLNHYEREIGKAFLKSEDGKLKVALSFDLAVSDVKAGAVDIDATITFTAEKVKDKISSLIMENQTELPGVK